MKTQHRPMRTVWHSLLWKEWHEHKWKLVALIVLAVMLSVMIWEGGEQVLPLTVSAVLFCYSILGGLFLGMHTAGGENGRGTMSFLQTLPVTMRKPAAIRLLMSWITVVIPVPVILGLAYAFLRWQNLSSVTLTTSQMGIFGNWGFQNWLVDSGLSGALCVSSLLLWMAAAGVNRADEISAGAVGFLTGAVVWFGLGGAVYQADKAGLLILRDCLFAAMTVAPGGPSYIGALGNESNMHRPFLLVIATIGHACVLVWYLHRFGRKAVRPTRTLGKRVKATKTDWLAPPRRSQLTAIIWKQVHETGPLALMAAAAILAMSGLAFWLDMGSPIENSYAKILAGITLFVGFLVTVVAGMGVFLEDIKPKVGIFWRSRPVNTTLWFFVKFSTGLTVLVATFGALLLLAFAFDTGRPLLSQDHAILQTTFVALTFVLMYTVSMASYCLGRQPVISAVAALGIFFCGIQAWDMIFQETVPHWSVGLATLLVAQVLATTIAWLAIRNNWGWHK